MQVYLAPMEGITGYVFRNAYAKYYGGVDKYFTPFITPHTKKLMDTREKRDILPENNEGLYIVPQVLTNKSEELIAICEELKKYGYSEVNLNIGCPSKTVTVKGKGSGFLEDVRKLDNFFEEFFAASDTKLSIKTRIGMWDLEEADRLFEIFEKYPFEEVIVHPRLGVEFYQGKAHRDVFEGYLQKSKHSLCYNGDINTKEDLLSLNEKWNNCDKYMLGRGLIANPAILSGDNSRFQEFHDCLLEGFGEYLPDDRTLLFRMKELWTWWRLLFPNEEKLIKKIKKTNTLLEYRPLVKQVIQTL